MANKKTLLAQIKQRSDTATNWTTADPVIGDGEIIVVETSAGEKRFKVGDGEKTFTQLPYADENILSKIKNYTAGDGISISNEGVISSNVDTQGDWFQNDETAPDYIKNRPGGYMEQALIGEKTFTLNFSTLDSNGLYKTAPTNDGFQISSESNMIVNIEFDGVLYSNVAYIYDSNPIYGDATCSNYPFYLQASTYLGGGAYEYTSYSTKQGEIEITIQHYGQSLKKISSQYFDIPPVIGNSSSYITNAKWNNNFGIGVNLSGKSNTSMVGVALTDATLDDNPNHSTFIGQYGMYKNDVTNSPQNLIIASGKDYSNRAIFCTANESQGQFLLPVDFTKPIETEQGIIVSYTNAESSNKSQYAINPSPNGPCVLRMGDSNAVAQPIVRSADTPLKIDVTGNISLDKNAKLANPNKLTFRGAATGEYDGSSAVTINIPEGENNIFFITAEADDNLNLSNISVTFTEAKQAVENNKIIVWDGVVAANNYISNDRLGFKMYPDTMIAYDIYFYSNNTGKVKLSYVPEVSSDTTKIGNIYWTGEGFDIVSDSPMFTISPSGNSWISSETAQTIKSWVDGGKQVRVKMGSSIFPVVQELPLDTALEVSFITTDNYVRLSWGTLTSNQPTAYFDSILALPTGTSSGYVYWNKDKASWETKDVSDSGSSDVFVIEIDDDANITNTTYSEIKAAITNNKIFQIKSGSVQFSVIEALEIDDNNIAFIINTIDNNYEYTYVIINNDNKISLDYVTIPAFSIDDTPLLNSGAAYWNATNKKWEIKDIASGSATQSNWQQNDATAADYIQNRPGAYDAQTTAFTLDYDLTQASDNVIFDSNGKLDYIIIGDELPGGNIENFIGSTLTVDTETYTITDAKNYTLAYQASDTDTFITFIGRICIDHHNDSSLTIAKWSQEFADMVSDPNRIKYQIIDLGSGPNHLTITQTSNNTTYPIPLNAKYQSLQDEYSMLGNKTPVRIYGNVLVWDATWGSNISVTTASNGHQTIDAKVPTYKAGNGISISNDGTISVTASKIYSGTSNAPSADLGENGDIYIQTEG